MPSEERSLSGSAQIWHPLLPYTDSAIKIIDAKGDILYTERGPFIDGIASWWAAILGHKNPSIVRAIKKQAEKLSHAVFADFVHEPAIELSELLGEILPRKHAPWHIFFSDDGSTAIEVAIKGALQFLKLKGYKRVRFITLENGYHGDTTGALSLTSAGEYSSPYSDLLFPVTRIRAPLIDDTNREDAIEEARSLVQAMKKNNEGGIFVYEVLIQGAGGMKMISIPEFNAILEIFDEAGCVLVADEIFTGLWRTGKPLASYYFNMAPHVICLSKAITGGTLPTGITAFAHYIYEEFVRKNAFLYHAHTYTGNPLACSAAIATLKLLMEPSIQKKIERLRRAFLKYAMKHSSSEARVRACGCVLAVEFTRMPPHINLKRYMMENGIYVRPLGNVLYLTPPYTISMKNLRKCLSAIENLVSHVALSG